MTISPRVLLSFVSIALAMAAFAADAPDTSAEGGAPETVKVASVESVTVGADERKLTFVLLKSGSGQCYAVAPPGGEGMIAGDAYAVVAANGIPDEVRAEITKARPACKVVDVVARVAK